MMYFQCLHHIYSLNFLYPKPTKAMSSFYLSILKTPSSPFLLGFLLVILPTFVYYLLHIRYKENDYKVPHGPRKLPIVGNLHQLGRLPHVNLWQLSQKYGEIMQFQLGHVPAIVVSSPELAKEVLKDHDLDTCTRPLSYFQKKISYDSRGIAFSPYGRYWKEMRKICNMELFTCKRVSSFGRVRESEVSCFVNTIAENYASTPVLPLEVDEICHNLARNIICKIAFGTNPNQFEDQKLKGILHDCLNLLGGLSASDSFPSFGWLIDEMRGLNRKMDNCFRDLDAFLQKIVDEHLNPNRQCKDYCDITDVLLHFAKDPTMAIQLTEEHIKAILLDIFVGSVDTTSVIMVWLMAELVKNPRVMKKVQDEIRGICKDKSVVPENELQKFKYFKLVVKETLRLHPPGSLLMRECISRCQINGYDVLPRTRIIVNTWALGRDPKFWERPDEFYPERFEKVNIDFRGAHFEYLPFGSGRRMCPGIIMGSTLVELVCANLLHCFDWELPDGKRPEELNMEEEYGLDVRKRFPLYLVPKKYKPGWL